MSLYESLLSGLDLSSSLSASFDKAAKERKQQEVEAAKERRRLYRHISNYPVRLLDEITRNGSITVAEREELNSYLYGR